VSEPRGSDQTGADAFPRRAVVGAGAFQRCAVVGAGAWGTALALAAARAGREVILWGRDGAAMAEMATSRRNARYLPDAELPRAIRPAADAAGLRDCDLVLMATPAQSLRAVTAALAGAFKPGAPLVLCAKGIERGTGAMMSEAAQAAAPGHPIAILSGPSFAEDVGRGLPTAVTLAASDAALARALAQALGSSSFRLYHATDVVGVELGGAAKNVLAIACGVAQGRGLGASANAALIARGFAEMARFARAHGARAETLMGLSGLGDLVLTCNSTQSRNFSLGVALGRGETLASADHGKLAEGALTAPALIAKAQAKGVEMPIAEAVAALLAGRIDVDGVIEGLMGRPQKAEH
jgi:glycerol-3-phosphate dehydrogenase (NAD(P)+)